MRYLRLGGRDDITVSTPVPGPQRGVAAKIGQSDAMGGVQENDARRRHEATGDVLFFP